MFRRNLTAWKLTGVFALALLVFAVAAHLLGISRAGHSGNPDEAPAFTLVLRAAIAGLIALVPCALGIWFVLGRAVHRPLNNLVEGMQRIARGDFDFSMDQRREDAFADAAESFNDMTAKFELLLQKLRENNEYLEGIVESSADIIVTVNQAGYVQTFNTGAELVLGYERKEVIDQPVEKLFADPAEKDAVLAQLRKSDHVANYETRLLTKNGENRDVIFSLSRLRGPYDFPVGTFAIGKDVTNEKRLQRRLIQSERFTAIGQSFTGLSHSMKNMLNALKGGAYLVRTAIKKNDQEMLADGWQMVEEGIGSITDLSKDMLKYMRDWEPEFAESSAATIVEKIENVVTQTAADRGVTFSTKVAPDLPDFLCDPNLIHSAIMDIVSNALEACQTREYEEGESAQITLAATHAEALDNVVIEVRDNGPGMTDRVKANIYTPFFSTKRNKGTGLGMALTARIVRLHGGTIDVFSEPGQGATFQVMLPVSGPDRNKEVSGG